MKTARIYLSVLLINIAIGSQAQDISADAYIEKYKADAVKDMLRTGVPASITLSQGMLESRNGNSPLALVANNHFGIKCHKDWLGETFFQDDDAKNECFRKYKNAAESFDDHSNFLKTRKRYAFLFEIKRTDYQAWAEGLKKAGYATNPKYPQLLIKIIEDHKLYELDKLEDTDDIPEVEKVVVEKALPKNNQSVNNTAYIIVKKGEGFLAIATKYNLDLWQIYKYNDLDKNAQLFEGQRVYIKPKRRKAAVDFHITKTNETMWSISQVYGIKLKHLYKKNRMETGSQPYAGQKLWMRSKKPADYIDPSPSQKISKL